jgi:L-alanine-DL-glutamate epimerase-like enolase superfamily enzyme
VLGIPCYKMLGSWTDKIQMAWCVNLNPLEGMVAEAQEMIRVYGFKTIKLKVGVAPDRDVEMVRAMRKELGDDIVLYVDANQGYDPFTALSALRRMADYSIILAEEPCPILDKKGRKMIAERLDMPLSGDESCVTPADVAREIELDCLRVVNIKTARTGFTLSEKIVHLCEQSQIKNLLGFQGDTGLGSLASAHFCAAHKNTSQYYASEASFFLWLLDDFLKEPIAVKDGWLELPHGPGLGVEIDERKLRKFAMS